MAKRVASIFSRFCSELAPTTGVGNMCSRRVPKVEGECQLYPVGTSPRHLWRVPVPSVEVRVQRSVLSAGFPSVQSPGVCGINSERVFGVDGEQCFSVSTAL